MRSFAGGTARKTREGGGMAQGRRWRRWLATPCHSCHLQYIVVCVAGSDKPRQATSVKMELPGAVGRLPHGVATVLLRAVKQGAGAGICNTGVTAAISGEKACFTTCTN